jgi:predicted GIY-YIG superfamily endonuclease
MKTYIYTLSTPSHQIRYVGKTINPKRRYKEHLYQKPKTHKNEYYLYIVMFTFSEYNEYSLLH